MDSAHLQTKNLQRRNLITIDIKSHSIKGKGTPDYKAISRKNNYFGGLLAPFSVNGKSRVCKCNLRLH